MRKSQARRIRYIGTDTRLEAIEARPPLRGVKCAERRRAGTRPSYKFDAEILARLLNMIKLRYPTSNTLEDLGPLYDEYKKAFPEIMAEWFAIENKSPEDFGPDDLKDIQYHVMDFLKSRTDWDTQAAVSMGFGLFRGLVEKDLLAGGATGQ